MEPLRKKYIWYALDNLKLLKLAFTPLHSKLDRFTPLKISRQSLLSRYYKLVRLTELATSNLVCYL
jgi:hypothetical protein